MARKCVNPIYLCLMRILDPKELERRRNSRTKKHQVKGHKRRLGPIILVLITVYLFAAIVPPVPNLQSREKPLTLPAAQGVQLPWPTYGQSALGAVGYGLLAQNGTQTPLPIASVAKVITAVAVLKVRPIAADTEGEVITLTAQDAATYNKYVAEGQSVVKVEAGERITQYQALQALLLPSANNMAEILVRWAFGSTEEYLAFVNPFTKTLGMKNTNVADASGFSPKTTSVAVDLARLGEIAMNHPIIAEIVGQKEATLPIAGTVYNVNNLLGQHGIVGIKTGNTDEAGGCYLFSAKRVVGDKQSITLVGVVMGAPDRTTAMQNTVPLINQAFDNFRVVNPLKLQEEVGLIKRGEDTQVPMKIKHESPLAVWNGQSLRSEVKINKLKSHIGANDEVGKITMYMGEMAHEIPLVAGGNITKRSLLWRLAHPHRNL